MAKIKLKFGDNEIEIESRDFYVDNETIGEVIERVSTHFEENRARIVYDPSSVHEVNRRNYHSSVEYLKTLDDAEVHEPEYAPPIPLLDEEIRTKLQILEKKSFFDKPRTVSETVSQLREFGWSASPLNVSKTLAKMAFNKEIIKNSQGNHTYYFAKKAILVN
jgi:hypothetical protein